MSLMCSNILVLSVEYSYFKPILNVIYINQLRPINGNGLHIRMNIRYETR